MTSITIQGPTLTDETDNPFRSRAIRKLVLLSVIVLPFTSTLTINIGFPLKLYEILLAVGISIVIVKGRMKIPKGMVSPLKLIAAIWIFSLIAFVVAMLVVPPGVYSIYISRRFGPVFDGVLALLYLLFALLGFYLLSSLAKSAPKEFADAWLTGAIICALYSIGLFALGMIGINPPPILGGNFQYIQLGNRLIVRNGTFLEGNYLALYLLLSGAIALHCHRRKTAFLLFGAVLTTFSTIGLLGLLIVLVLENFSLLPKMTNASRLLVGILFALFVIFCVLIVSQSDYFYAVFTSKIIEGPDASVSLPQRFDNALSGLNMFVQYPLTGVGIGQYSYHFFDYTQYMTYLLGNAEVLPASIANNVYVQILSEQGLIVFCMFVVFLLMTYRRMLDHRYQSLRIGFLIMMLALFAFPSYTYMFLWAYWAYIWGMTQPQNEEASMEKKWI